MLEVHAILQRQRCNENITKKTGTLSDAYGLLVFRGDAFGCHLCFVCRPGGIFNSDFIAIARTGNRVELRFHMVPG